MAGLAPEELKKELKIALKRGRNYIFSPGKPLEKSVLLLSKKAIPPGERNKAKKSSGSPKVYWGVCKPEEQILVFEVLKDFPAKLNLDLLRYIKKVAGLKSIDVLFRVNPNMTELDAEGDGEEGDGGTVTRADLDTKLETVKKGLAWVAKTKPDNTRLIVDAYKKAQALIEAQELGAAMAAVEETLSLSKEAMLAAKAKAATKGKSTTGAKPTGPSVSPTACVAAAKAWTDARTAVNKQLAAVKKAILAEYKKHPQRSRIKSAAGRLDEVLAKLNDKAAQKFTAAAKAKTEDDRMTLVTDARGDLAAYQTYVDKDPIVAALTKNPFVPAAVKDTVTKAIASIDPILVPAG